MPRVLAFDIGIKNLAWCCLDVTADTYKIIGWDNYNLLSESSNVGPKAKKSCHQCSAKALYSNGGIAACSRHCPAATPPLRDASGNLLKKIPKVEVLRALLSSKGLVKVPTKKQQVLSEVEKLFSIPQQEVKVSKAPDAGLVEIHNSLQHLVQQHNEMWSQCTEILLENQPAFKNPTMKSVQILLFATLRDKLTTVPKVRLVHAGKKVAGATKGDAGYKERKSGSETKAALFLGSTKLADVAKWKQHYTAAAKKSDLADALVMCCDACQIDLRPESA